MADIKAGDLGLESLDSQQQWDQNYATLIKTTDPHVIMNIMQNASSEEMDYYMDTGFDILFSGKAPTGVLEHVGTAASAVTAGVAGGATAAALGATTVTTSAGGILGFLGVTTTAVAAAPLALVAGAAAGAAAIGYGAYKLASGSAKDRGKDEQFQKVKQEGRYHIGNSARKFNPFVFLQTEYNYINEIYQILTTLPSTNEQDMEKFLQVFDGEKILNADQLLMGREDKWYKQGYVKDENGLDIFLFMAEDMRNELCDYLHKYCEKMKRRYEFESKELINSYVAFLEINNEYITPRVAQTDNKEFIEAVQKGEVYIHSGHIAYQEFRAVFSVYKMLLNHSQNTSKQIELQKEKMYERAEKLGATELFENILAEHRLVKLDETNYIRYLQEVVSVLDSKDARAFINELTNDIAECMLVDSVMEPYEKEIMQNIANTFSNLLDTNRQKLTAF
ncbi:MULTISPECIES: hypothetical protein [Helicobacter]|uniref:Uncharacterized protein n=1 Tax=Helicobacter bilis ATCC 43879 TaxID=613026 RepID=C3XFA7_9HELI|nr:MULTISPECIES: hypothetical protein [Helicobacter]EEO23696.1 hypothetical protein HRAG_00753 [Helicobacter bilis ATCC 43879]